MYVCVLTKKEEICRICCSLEEDAKAQVRLDDLFLGLYFTRFQVKSQKSVVYSGTVLISTMCPLCASVFLYYSYFICRQEGCPRIHLGPVAAGRHVVKEDRLRQQFATQVGALAFDCEFDSVIESILGNCKDSFVCIRGINTAKHFKRKY